MKTILSTLLFVASLNLAAQQVEVRYSYPEWDAYHTKPKGEKHQVNVFSKTKKGKRLQSSFNFNEQGLVAQEFFFKKNGKVSKQSTWTYNNSGRITRTTTIKDNKLRSMHDYSYLNDTLLVLSKRYYKDTTAPRWSSEFEYGALNKLKQHTGYNSKKQQTYRYEYVYYENGSRKETRYFNKGKLKHTWVYDCDMKGELSTSHTEKICKQRVYDPDSSFTEVYENTVDGKVSRSIVKSAADGRVLERSIFNAKGKLLSRSVYQYNANNKLVKLVSYKKNSQDPKYIELYEYDTDNSLLVCLRVDPSGSIKYRREYSYN